MTKPDKPVQGSVKNPHHKQTSQPGSAQQQTGQESLLPKGRSHKGKATKTGQFRTPQQLAPFQSPTGKGAIRIRVKRLEHIDEEKLALAYWLLAKRIASNHSEKQDLTIQEIEEVAKRVDERSQPPAGQKKNPKRITNANGALRGDQ